MPLPIPLPQLGERDRRALQILVLAGGLILLTVYVIFPLWDAAADSGNVISLREKTLRKYRALAQAAPEEESGLKTLKARLQEAEAGLLAAKTGPLAAAEVQQLVRDLATAQGIQVRNVDFMPPRKLGADYAAVPVSASFNAGMDQVTGLLNALQGNAKILVLDQMNLTAANNADLTRKQVNAYLVIYGVGVAEVMNKEK